MCLLISQHVSAFTFHLHGVTVSLFISESSLSAFRVCVGCCSLVVATCWDHTEETIAHTYPKCKLHLLINKKVVTPEDGTWKSKHLGELISTIKNAYEHSLDIFHRCKNARYSDQGNFFVCKLTTQNGRTVLSKGFWGRGCNFSYCGKRFHI
jgi:hypothetical protein